MRPSNLVPIPLVLLAATLAGCLSREEYEAQADAESYALVARARVAAGQKPDPDFSIDPDPDPLRGRLLLARDPDQAPGPRERLAREGAGVEMDLGSALSIAARNSRDYQNEKERLYQAALDLTTARHDFETQFFGTAEFTALSAGDGESDATVSVGENGAFGFTQLLERGGALTLSIGDSLTRFLTNPASSVATGFVNLALSLPLLRGAGREIAYENVTQAELDVIYAVRAFERFKRGFAVDVVSEYLRLLQSLNTIQNEKANYERRQQTAIENRALGEAGRLAVTDVERANQSELLAENRWINARESHANALDRFKLTLGLPTDAVIDVDPEDLASLVEAGVDELDVGGQPAMLVALANRLDLATAESRVHDARRRVNVAADALLAGLDFTASVDGGTSNFAEESFKLDPLGDGTYSLGLLLDLPLDRVRERNAYRSAIIDYQALRRSAEQSEDQIKAEVRRDLRSLHQARESYRIQLEAEKVAKTNVEAAALLKAAGEGTTNDVIDAQNDLISAQNAVTAALIDYTITRLQLFRDMEVLVVTPEGIDYETTKRLCSE